MESAGITYVLLGRELGARTEDRGCYVEGKVQYDRLAQTVWMGVSIETAKYLGRADHLRKVPVAVRFLSLEPLLGPLGALDLSGIHWVIACLPMAGRQVGGESGPGARPMEAAWVRDIRKQCRREGVPFFFKQWGGVQKGCTVVGP